MKFSMKNFFSKCDQIRNLHRICSHLLKKFLMKKFIILCSVSGGLRILKLATEGVTESIRLRKAFVILKGASKLYFMRYWWVVISLHNTGLFKCAFSTYYIGKLVFRFSLLSLLSVCSSCRLHKSFFTDFATFMLPLFIQVPAAMWFFFLTLKNSPNKPITEENIFLERFWVFKKYFTYKEVSEQLQDERM